MLSWISEQKHALLAVSTDVSLPCEVMSCQWQLTEKVLCVLQPFEEATKEVQYLTASISTVIPIVNALIQQLEKECEDKGIRAMKRKLLASLLSQYQDMKLFAVATMLDPCYKLRCFSSASKGAGARQMLMEEVEKLKVEALEESQDLVSSAKRPQVSRVQSEGQSLLLSCVEEMLEHSCNSETEPDSPEIIVTAYLKEPNLPMSESVPNPIDPEKPITRRNDPLLYWKNNEQSKLLLAKLARRFLCAPPGSVPSERLFSTAGD